MAEYALILGGIAVVVIAGILILGPAIRDLFSSTGSSVTNFPSSLALDGGPSIGRFGAVDRSPARLRARESAAQAAPAVSAS